ncbi:uncharacterized protein Z518_09609 [Rhinocladiella mackenziei CBS 650.93]|uniref:Peptidase A2 domain-containing protein n=1 Tax=Rhinocladiella mackenziei CBS 650.93 TaxID=1442369 RepID=A0A0D2I462_9EURO|nr:uncharacterized protein Z518_09609 [Rhinocladiella mackenziei CBS 650.93]KIX00544.1 hypothetical protein Z518_09609 [Rhinocladiella mackenziei CBS 650.93]
MASNARSSHPLWGTPSGLPLPYFNGTNVTEFLRTFDDFCDDFGYAQEVRAARVVRYCTGAISAYLRSLPEYTAGVWSDMKTAMLKEWESEDDEQRMKTTAFLEALSQRPRTATDDIKLYCRQFKTAADYLISTGRTTTYQSGIWFLRGLPEFLRRKVLADGKIDVNEPDTVRFEAIHKKAIEEWAIHKAIQSLDQVPAKEDVQDLADKIQSKPVVDKEKNAETENPKNTEGNPSQESFPRFNRTPGVRLAEKALQPGYEDELVEAMTRKLVMPLRAEMDMLRGEIRGLRSVRSHGVMREHSHPHGDQLPEGRSGGVRDFICYFCREGSHHRNDCPELLKMISEGLIHLNEERKICLGRYVKGAPAVKFPANGIAGRDHIRYLIDSSKPVEEMRVSSIRLGIESSSKSVEDDSEEEYIGHRVGVAAARSNLRGKAKQSETSHSVQGVSKVLKSRQREEASLPVAKSLRGGNYVQAAVEEAESQRVPQTVSFSEEVQEIPDDENDTIMVESSAEASKAAPARRLAMHGEIPTVGKEKLSKVLGRMNGPEKLANLLLNQRVDNVTVQGILSGSADVRRILFSRKEWEYDEDKDVVSTAKSPNRVSSLRMDGPGPLVGFQQVRYQAACPILPVETRLGVKEALLDTGAEVNVMSFEMAEALGLPLEPPGALHGISFDGSSKRFLGVIRDLDVKVLDVVVNVHMFVAKVVDPKYKMILGNPYQASARAKITRDEESNCFVELRDQKTHKTVRLHAASAAFEEGDRPALN